MAENDSHYNGTADITNMNEENGMNGDTSMNGETSMIGENGMNGETTSDAGNDNGMPASLPGIERSTPDTPMSVNREANTTIAIPWVPGFPSCPSCGSMPSQSFGQVRFLNASTSGITVNIAIDNTTYAPNSRFGTLSNYDWISDGFHTVTIQRANGIRSLLLQQTFPFAADQKVTMVLTDSPEGGLELIRVIDSGCRNLPAGSGCFRFANMTYSGSNLDLMLSGQTIFRNVRYQSVSSYKQAVAGVYQFSAVTAASYTFMRELPVIVLGIIGSTFANRETIFTFHTRIQAGRNYTAYLIGNNWSNSPMQVIIAED